MYIRASQDLGDGRIFFIELYGCVIGFKSRLGDFSWFSLALLG
jgi:hypothetical protein